MSKCGDDPVRDACGHALAWLAVANGVGLWLALMLWFPSLNHSEWTYGRWVPVHLNLQLYLVAMHGQGTTLLMDQ